MIWISSCKAGNNYEGYQGLNDLLLLLAVGTKSTYNICINLYKNYIIYMLSLSLQEIVITEFEVKLKLSEFDLLTSDSHTKVVITS